MPDSKILCKCADECEINLKTLFRWRHRFLELPSVLKATEIEGIIEADETLFLNSEKGTKKLNAFLYGLNRSQLFMLAIGFEPITYHYYAYPPNLMLRVKMPDGFCHYRSQRYDQVLNKRPDHHPAHGSIP